MRISIALLAVLASFTLAGCFEGSPGPQGDKGSKGERGDKGDIGELASLGRWDRQGRLHPGRFAPSA